MTKGKKLKEKKASIYERASHEWYVDTPSVSDALFRVESFPGSIHDPCAGMGNIVRMAIRHGYSARASDINPRPEHYRGLMSVLSPEPVDFLSKAAEKIQFASIVMNPPYGADGGEDRLEERFIDRALDLARFKVAAVVRLQWLVPRMEWLQQRSLIRVWLLAPRPSMLPGENIVAGEMPGGGGVDYAWVVFLKGAAVAATIGVARRETTFDKPDFWTWRLGKGG